MRLDLSWVCRYANTSIRRQWMSRFKLFCVVILGVLSALVAVRTTKRIIDLDAWVSEIGSIAAEPGYRLALRPLRQSDGRTLKSTLPEEVAQYIAREGKVSALLHKVPISVSDFGGVSTISVQAIFYTGLLKKDRVVSSFPECYLRGFPKTWKIDGVLLRLGNDWRCHARTFPRELNFLQAEHSAPAIILPVSAFTELYGPSRPQVLVAWCGTSALTLLKSRFKGDSRGWDTARIGTSFDDQITRLRRANERWLVVSWVGFLTTLAVYIVSNLRVLVRELELRRYLGFPSWTNIFWVGVEIMCHVSVALVPAMIGAYVYATFVLSFKF